MSREGGYRRKKLLLVEDDKSLGGTLSERLEKEGFDVTWSETVSDARHWVKSNKYHLAILDVGLPDGNGFVLGRELKASGHIPLMYLTAQSGAEDRLEGYEIGAEEFIPKPFHLKELLLRVRHILDNHSTPEPIRLGNALVDFESMSVEFPDRRQALSLKEAQILKALFDASPRVLSRDEILNRFWGENEFPSTRTIDNVILKLRQALGVDLGKQLKSVRGVGYQWVTYE